MNNFFKLKAKHLPGIFAVILLLCFLSIYYSISPSDFPQNEIISIKKGTHLGEAAAILKEKNVIKSTTIFEFFVLLSSGHRSIQAGDYYFNEPISAIRVANRLINGIQGLPKIKVTFYEGMSVKEMGNLLSKRIQKFDSAKFISLASPFEGYLYPDTYYFYANTTPEAVVDQLKDTFKEKIQTISSDIGLFNKPPEDIIKMASIVEKEATSSADRRLIAGILWKRLEKSMPLQVDATFYYTLGKASSQLTKSDLASDSEYNLYKHKGLPPTPISNPGLNAILDTVHPTQSKYYFYLAGTDGITRYAVDYDGHTDNKWKYMK